MAVPDALRRRASGCSAVAETATGPYRQLFGDVRILPILGISMMGTTGVGVIAPVLPAIATGLGVSDARIGLLVSAFTLPLALLAPVSGSLSDLFGRRYVVLPSLFVFGLTGVAATFLDDFVLILGLRVVQGAAAASIMPVSVTLVGDYYTGATSSAAQGLRTAANGVMAIVVPLVVSVLASIYWVYPFLVYGAALPTMVLAYRYLPVVDVGQRDGLTLLATFQQYARDIRAEMTDPRVAVLLSGGGMRDFSKYALITFVPIFAVRELNASYIEAGTVLSARGIVYIFAAPSTGAFVARLSKKVTMVIALALSVVSLALVPKAGNTTVLAILVVSYSVGDALFAPVLKDTLTTAVATEHRGGIVSALTVGKNLAKTISPIVFGGILALWGFSPLFLLAALALLAYAVTVAWLY